MMISNSNNIIQMAYNNLTSTNNAIEKTARALSTGQRISTAADDAAGFAIGQGLSAQIAGVDRAIRNSQDGISMLQVAEGAMNQINSMLQRMRELVVQAANDTLTTQDRGYIQQEIGELRKNIDSVASNTTFNTKRLLDGSSSAIWSSDDANIKVKTTGAITLIDQFSQRKQTEGNYRIEVKTRAGRGQIQKSAIFTAQVPEYQKITGDSDSAYSEKINISALNDSSWGEGWEFSDGVLTISESGNYSIEGGGDSTSNRIVINPGVSAQLRLTDVDITSDSGAALEANDANVILYLKGENTLSSGEDGHAGIEVQRSGSITINSYEGYGSEEGTLTAVGLGEAAGIGGADDSVGSITINSGTIISTGGSNGGAGIGSGANSPSKFASVMEITINGGSITATGNGGAAAIGGGLNSNGGIISINKNLDMNLEGWIDSENGATESIGRGENGFDLGRVEYFGNDTTLRDIPQFYNASGVFAFETPQKLTIIQGNGKTTDVTLYSTDTIDDVKTKLNDAIAFGLGHASYADNVNDFVSFVYDGQQNSSGSESVAGTFVIRSGVAGSAGNLTFTSDNQDLINLLGLNTIQYSQDNQFTVSIYDAHNGKTIVENLATEGNSINGVLSQNMSIEFDSMANVKAHWDEATKNYYMASESDVYSAILHIQDRSTSFQIGQNWGEDIYINIGDLRAEALGLNEVDVSTFKNASKSITLIDMALHKVNSQRSKVGAYQNELEYNANSLTNTSLHLQESESRLKDADMAKEYMEFVKLQILNGTGTSMLAQANQNSQNLMKIMGV